MSAEPVRRIETDGIAVVRRPRRAIGWLFHAAWALFSIGAIAFGNGSLRWATFAQWMACGIPPLAIFAARGFAPIAPSEGKTLRPARAELEADALVIVRPDGSRTRIERGAVRQGWQVPWSAVVLELRLPKVVTIGVRTAADGEAILRALGVAADQRVWSAYADSEASRREGTTRTVVATAIPVGLVLLVVALASSMIQNGAAPSRVLPICGAIAATLMVWVYAELRQLAPRRVLVGSDGVEMRWLGGREFLPFSRVLEATPDKEGVRLTLSEGGDVVIPCCRPLGVPGPPQGTKIGMAHRDAVLERIRAALAASKAAPSSRADASLLARGGRSLARWREDLTRLAREGIGYRDLSIAQAELVTVVEDGAAAPEQRVAAAVALSLGGDPEVKRRVRVAADAAANEHLRAAMEAAAEGEIEEAELERAERARSPAPKP